MLVPNLHPLFAQPSDSILSIVDGDESELYRFQLSSLKREPNNLRLHVQLLFNLIQKEGVGRNDIFGALLDLYIVLQDKGLPLRRRMLAVCKPFLTDEDVRFFLQHLERGVDAKTVVADSGCSQLSENYSGDAHFIKKVVVQLEETVMSAYEEALSLIEYGELSEAAVLLEQALKQQPDGEQIAEELLTIYSHQQDEDAIAALRDWFFEQELSLPKCWPLM